MKMKKKNLNDMLSGLSNVAVNCSVSISNKYVTIQDGLHEEYRMCLENKKICFSIFSFNESLINLETSNGKII